MTPSFDVRPIEADDLDQYFDVRAQSFGIAASEREEWKELIAGAPEIVGFGAFRSGRLLGALRIIPGGQYVRRRSVRMGGIAAVVVRPEARATGVARGLLTTAVGWMRDTGIAVSSLHPASTRAYRSAGWELAGRAGWLVVPTRSFSAIRGDAAGAVEPLDPSDTDAIHGCHASYAAGVHGAVDRSLAFWYLHEQVGSADGAFVYGVRGGAGLSGYIAFTQTPDTRSWGYSIRVDDFVALDRPSAVALWRFIGGHSMQVERVRAHLSALPMLAYLLDEQDGIAELENHWMHRIVDVPGAIAARGYPVGIDTGVDVIVTDSLEPDAARAWTISVSDARGQANATTASDDAVRLDIGALSALSIGGTTAAQLRTVGRLTGPDDAVDRLDAVLGAPTPTITDDF